MSRLADYLEAKRAGGWGWRAEYNKKLTDGMGADDGAWLVGWYGGMLDEMIEAIGVGSACRIVHAKDEIRTKAEQAEKEACPK